MEYKLIPCPAHDLELSWKKEDYLSFCDDDKAIILIGYRVVLTPYEYEIVKLLYNESRAIKADDIVQRCFKRTDVMQGNVAVHVHNINQKAFAITNRKLIVSDRGHGYQINDNI